MKIHQKICRNNSEECVDIGEAITIKPSLVLVFGNRESLEKESLINHARSFYPDAHYVICSTAGEIIGSEFYEDSVVLTAIEFEKSSIRTANLEISSSDESFQAGASLASQLLGTDLVHILLFSNGTIVNGSKLVEGINSVLPKNIATTGGLAGDGNNFVRTLVGYNDNISDKQVVAVGIYGNGIKIGYGSLGGWDSFGLERQITKSKDNILYELDGKSALALYKEYLGELATELPGSGLLFPLKLKLTDESGKNIEVVRTILGIDEKTGGMIFAGDMPKGASAMLMKANFDRIIDGASGAGGMSIKGFEGKKPDFALLISCVGRKLVLKDRTIDEIQAVRDTIGKDVPVAGFYSYGEICPVAATEKQCQLHNQTMTITTFLEV